MGSAQTDFDLLNIVPSRLQKGSQLRKWHDNGVRWRIVPMYLRYRQRSGLCLRFATTVVMINDYFTASYSEIFAASFQSSASTGQGADLGVRWRIFWLNPCIEFRSGLCLSMHRTRRNATDCLFECWPKSSLSSVIRSSSGLV